MKTIATIDDYILSKSDFAKPILEWFRAIVHDTVKADEALKWSFPHFIYKGKILASMAAFTNHCSIGIPILEQLEPRTAKLKDGMGQFGKIKRIEDLPSSRTLALALKKAAKAIDQGVNPMGKRTKKKASADPIPPDFSRLLKNTPAANAFFSCLSNSHKNEYIRWINQAKRDETRTKRLKQAILLLSESKRRDWKYDKK